MESPIVLANTAPCCKRLIFDPGGGITLQHVSFGLEPFVRHVALTGPETEALLLALREHYVPAAVEG